MSIEIHIWMAVAGLLLIATSLLILLLNRAQIRSLLLNFMIRRLFDNEEKGGNIE